MAIERERIIQAFTNYGYVTVDACEPDDPDLLKDIKTFNLEFIYVSGNWNCPEYKMQGLYMDIKDVIAMHWGDTQEYMEGFVNISKGEK